MKRKWIYFYIILHLVYLLSACKINDNTLSNNDENTDVEDTKSPINEKNDYIEDDDNYKSIPTEFITETVNNFFINGYRNHNMRCKESERLHEGDDLKYKVYYAGNNILFVKFDKTEDQDYNFSYFRITGKLIQQEFITDENKLNEIWNSGELQYVCNGSFTVDSNSYDDFDSKEERLSDLNQYITYRYFDNSEDKTVDDKPIFYETTKAEKVYLLDFDDKSRWYNVLVFTENGYVYDASMEYIGVGLSDHTYEFSEQPLESFQIDAIQNFDDSRDTDPNLSEFVNYYNYAMKHIISVIDEKGIHSNTQE